MFFLSVSTAFADLAFQPGEKLVFEAFWGLIKVAVLEFEVNETAKDSNFTEKTLLLRGKCRSVDALNSIYPINSTIESYAHAESLIPIYFTEDRKEGRHVYLRTMTYDFEAKRGVWSNKISGHDKHVHLPRRAYDQLSALYALRKNGLSPNSYNNLEVIADGRYELIKFTVSDVEKKSLGKWAALPLVTITSQDIMEHAVKRKASVKIIATADKRHIPIQINLQTSWGNLRLDLKEAKNLTGKPLPYLEVKRPTNRLSSENRKTNKH